MDIDELVRQELANPDRLESLRDTTLFDSPRQRRLDSICRMVARQLKAPYCLLNLLNSDQQYVLAAFGTEPDAIARDNSASYCKFVVGTRKPFRVNDAEQDEWVCMNPNTVSGMVRAYLGVPVTSWSGYVLGTLCVFDTVPREWSDENLAFLEHQATAAMAVAQS
jgi:GAF domain-containing protein